MSANVIPVGVCDENGGQFRQVGCIRSQRLIGGLRGVRARTRIDANQFSPIVGNHKIVFRELETRERVDAPGHNLADSPRHESTKACPVAGSSEKGVISVIGFSKSL